MDKELLAKAQKAVDENTDSIQRLFSGALKQLGAQGGFFGREDQRGWISIVVCEGKYFHLPKTQGFTGVVYSSKKAQICDMRPPFDDASALVQAEMGAPVFLGSEPVGVLIVDRHIPKEFTNEDLRLLISYSDSLGDILCENQPWPFRKWWKRTERRWTHSYRQALEHDLLPVLRQHVGMYATTALLQGKDLVDFTTLAARGPRDGMGGRVADLAIKTGRAELNPRRITRGELAVPFPWSGPIRGVVQVERYLDKEGPDDGQDEMQDLKAKIERAIESLEYAHTGDPAADIDDPGARYNAMLLECRSREKPLLEILDAVVTHLRALCNADAMLYLNEAVQEWVDTERGSGIRSEFVSSDRLTALLPAADMNSNRPRYSVSATENTLSGQLTVVCPVWVENELTAVLVVKQTRNAEDEVEYNGPLLETIATALGGTLWSHRRLAILSRLATLHPDGSAINESYLRNYLDLCRAAVGANMLSLWTEHGPRLNLIAKSDKPQDTAIPLDAIMSLARATTTANRTLHLQDTSTPENTATLRGLGIPVEKCAEIASSLKSALGVCIRSVDGRLFALFAATSRTRSFRASFDIEDRMTMNLVAGMLLPAINRVGS